MNQILAKSLLLAIVISGAGMISPRTADARLESANAAGGSTSPVLSFLPVKSFLPVMSFLEDIPELPMADGSSDTPEMEVTMLDGKKIKLSSMRGKVCIIDLFAPWCPHCQDHAPEMAKVYSQFSAQGLEILSLANPREKAEDVKKFIKDYNVNYPVGFYSNEVLAYFADPRNHGIPQIILFGKNGKMSKRWIGWSDARTKELVEILDSELKTSAPAADPKKN